MDYLSYKVEALPCLVKAREEVERGEVTLDEALKEERRPFNKLKT